MKGKTKLGKYYLTNLKNFLIFSLIINILSGPTFALNFDTSLDDDVRKSYNPSKIEQDMLLPRLPNVLNVEEPINENIIAPPKLRTIPEIEMTRRGLKVNRFTHLSAEKSATLKRGKKIEVQLLNNISDRTRIGTPVSFVSQYPVSTTYLTIPMGTRFEGKIIQTHGPQWTGNGGLIVMKINSVVLNGQTYSINANVTKANFKHIFFNNIKGKRKYMISMFKSIKPGVDFFKKMIQTTGYLASDGSSILVSPFSILIGVIGLTGNVLVSPVIAIFHKGDSVFINSGSNFEIKLLQDLRIYN